MKRKLGLILVVALLVLMVGPLAALASGYVRATGDLNVRSSPSLSGKELGTIYSGSTASYLGSSSVDDRGVRWYKVSFKGSSGWVSSRYCTLNDVSRDTSYIRATGDLNVRSSPSLDGKEIGGISSGNTASYLGQSSVDDRGVRWYKISYKGGSGWVSSRYCTLVDGDYYGDDLYGDGGYGYTTDEYVDRGYDTYYYSDSGYIRATGDLNVRNAPNLDGRELGTIYSGGTASYLGIGSTDSRGVRWYKISYNGGSGWVSSRYCDLITGTYRDYDYAPSYIKAVGGDLNVRSSPSLGGKLLGTIMQGNTASYLNASSTDSRGVVWYKISYKGSAGWVSSMYANLYY